MNPFNSSRLGYSRLNISKSIFSHISFFKHRSWQRLVSLYVVALLMGIGSFSLALESDFSKPVTFTSDTLELNEQKGTTTYIGEVVVERGSMKINAEIVTVYYSEQGNGRGGEAKIVAQGKPASYQQKPSQDKDIIIAKANTIEYSFKDESLHLIEAASLKQGGTSLTGNRIDYDAQRSIVKAGGSLDKKERVRMVIPPKAMQQKPSSQTAVDETKDQSSTSNSDTK